MYVYKNSFFLDCVSMSALPFPSLFFFDASSMCWASLQPQPCANLAFVTLHSKQRLLNSSFTWSFSQSTYTSLSPFMTSFEWDNFFLPVIRQETRKCVTAIYVFHRGYRYILAPVLCTETPEASESFLTISEIVIGGLILMWSIKGELSLAYELSHCLFTSPLFPEVLPTPARQYDGQLIPTVVFINREQLWVGDCGWFTFWKVT